MMANPQKILITAGEVSGDLLGAEIMAALKQRLPEVTFFGIGGPAMAGQGLQALGSMDDFPGMGLVEVLGAIPKLKKLIGRLGAWAEAHGPDLCITLDNQEFSARLAARLQPLGTPCVLYPAPKVWAWRQHRVVKLQKLFRHVLCLFPFETDFFTAHNLPATYIGHPVARRLHAMAPASNALPAAQTIALLPGSRRNELTYHWPLFLDTFTRLRTTYPGLTAVLPLPDEAALARCQALGWAEGITPVLGEARFTAMQSCRAALTKSGTNNLELALLGVPAIVAYRMHPLTFAILKKLVKVPAISPVNLVANGLTDTAKVYPELIQHAASAKALVDAITPLLSETPERTRQQSGMADVRHKLHTKQHPADLAADVMVSYL